MDSMKPETRPKLEMVGHDGNAFSILARATRAARKAKWTEEQIESYKKEAMAGDYDHLLMTTMDWFNCDGEDDG